MSNKINSLHTITAELIKETEDECSCLKENPEKYLIYKNLKEELSGLHEIRRSIEKINALIEEPLFKDIS